MYAAEEAAFGGTDLDVAASLDALATVTARIVGGDWWKSCSGPAVELVAAAAGVTSSSARSVAGERIVVRLTSDQLTLATLTHELAHAFAGTEHGHDSRFRAALVDLTAVVAGADLALALADRYVDFGVSAGDRAWPPPIRARGPGFIIVP